MLIRRIKQLIAKIFYKVIHSEYYDKLKPNENSVSYIKNNLKLLGHGAIFPKNILIKNPKYISIGDNFVSLYNLRIEAWDRYGNQNFEPEIIIGDEVVFNTDCHVGCIDKVIIGNHVMIASRVYISDHSHGDNTTKELEIITKHRKLISRGPVIIEDNVWIGEGVCILPNVTIGKNSIIGANAVVTKSFPANSIIAGVPAKLIREIL
jgi:acetyltransferase-like isoleucine patch superfamily enzyme